MKQTRDNELCKLNEKGHVPPQCNKSSDNPRVHTILYKLLESQNKRVDRNIVVRISDEALKTY